MKPIRNTVIWGGKEQKLWLQILPNKKYAWGFTKKECERHYEAST
jgi:hypothetical protein